MERHLTSPEFEDTEPLSGHEGEPFIIKKKVEMQEKARDDELGPSGQKCLRDNRYEADNDDSNARSHSI